MLRKICAPVKNDPEEWENIYQLIISGALLYPGLGPANRIAAIREATCVIHLLVFTLYFWYRKLYFVYYTLQVLVLKNYLVFGVFGVILLLFKDYLIFSLLLTIISI